MTERHNRGPYPEVPGMEYSFPLYVIPTEYWDSAFAQMQGEPIAFYGDGVVRVYAAPAALNDMLLTSDTEDYDGEPLTAYGSSFRTVYTPTEVEVCRALRGPTGPVGAMGPMGMPGAPGDDRDLQDRIGRLERASAAAMRAITTTVTTLTNAGVIDADSVINNNPKEK